MDPIGTISPWHPHGEMYFKHVYIMHIYFFDYYNPLNNNGICTYRNILLRELGNYSSTHLHVVYLCSYKYRNITSVKTTDIEEIHCPFDIVSKGKLQKQDNLLAEYLSTDINHQNQVIFHFNWINHGLFSHSIKKVCPNVYTLLTKHCIPWRDFIYKDYQRYLHIINRYSEGRRASVLEQRLLWDECLAYHMVDKILTVTYDAYQVLAVLFGIRPERLERVHNGIYPYPLPDKDKSRELKQKYNFNGSEKIVLFSGSLSQRKGLEILSKLINELTSKRQDIIFAICGDGDFQLILKNLTPSSYRKVIFYGEQPQEKIHELLSISTLGIVPSLAEQCSYSALEMLSHGLPLIGTNSGGLKEILTSEVGIPIPIYYFTDGYCFDLHQTCIDIENVLDNLDLYTSKASAARARITTFFSATNMTKRTFEAYQSLTCLNKPKSSPLTPLVSIILPCFNSDQYISEAIDSVLNQLYSNWELIIIDDGSDEPSKLTLQKYQKKDTRIQVLENKTNQGIVYSLNRGIAHARGIYIARLDADDIMRYDRLQKQVEYLETHPQIDFIGTAHITIDEHGTPLSYVSYPSSDDPIRVLSLFFNPYSHPTVMFRQEVIKNIRYTDDYPYNEDYDLWLRLNKSYQGDNIADPLTFYRLHEQNLSLKNREAQILSAIERVLDECDYLGIEISDKELEALTSIHTRHASSMLTKHEQTTKGLITKLCKHLHNKEDKETVDLLWLCITKNLL